MAKVLHNIVICGNRRQAESFMMVPPHIIPFNSRIDFVIRANKIRGINNANVFLFGTYYDLPEWSDIREQLRIRSISAPDTFRVFDSRGYIIPATWY